MTILKPPFAYYGGKTTLGPRIAAALPAHRHYVEPFAGSLAVLLAKPPSLMETANDLDGAIVTFWRVRKAWTYVRYPGTGAEAPAKLTDAGRSLLSRWNEEHPEVTRWQT